MSVDPADDCTFWYVNEYLPANGTFNWNTRIGSFKFSGCGATGPSVSASPSTVSAGGRVTVSWSGVSNATNRDWIGLYHPGDPDGSFISWVYDDSCTTTGGTSSLASGSCSFTMPMAAGTYELRLFSNDGFTRLASSNQVTVTGGASITVTPSSVAGGGSVTVSWSGVPNPTTQDWVGLYHPGDPNGSFIDWFWDSSCTQTVGSNALSSGSCTYKMPTVAGTYRFRLFRNNGFMLLAKSGSVSVG
jgi:hypothetical protein